MKNRIQLTLTVAFLLVVLLAVTGCKQQVTNIDWQLGETSEFGTVTLKVELPELREVAALSSGIENVDHLIVIMSSSVYPNIVATDDLAFGVGEVQIENVRPGDWKIVVHLEDVNDAVLYRAEKVLTIESGQAYNIRMMLEATSGVGIGFDIRLEQQLSDNSIEIQSMEGPNCMVISPDGMHAYVVADSDNAVLVFNRDPATGMLTYTGQNFRDGVDQTTELSAVVQLAMSADGKSLYVIGAYDDAITAFSRESDSSTGEQFGKLSFLAHYKNGEGGVTGMDYPWDIAVAPDGKNVYVVAYYSETLVTFDRNDVNGLLTFDSAVTDDGVDVDSGFLYAVQGVTVTEDNTSVYVTSSYTGSSTYTGATGGCISAFNRSTIDDGTYGELTFDATNSFTMDEHLSLRGAVSVTTTADSDFLYVASSDYYSDSKVTIFSRDTATTNLTMVDFIDTGSGAQARHLTISPNEDFVLVAAGKENGTSSSLYYRDNDSGSDDYGKLNYGFNIPKSFEMYAIALDDTGLTNHIYALDYHNSKILFLVLF